MSRRCGDGKRSGKGNLRLVGGEGRELIYVVCKLSPELARQTFFFRPQTPPIKLLKNATKRNMFMFVASFFCALPVIGIQRPRTEFGLRSTREHKIRDRICYLQKNEITV